MQFNQSYFSFDGRYSRQYNYKIITLEDNGFETVFGLDRSVDKEKGVNGEDVYYGESGNDMTLTVTIAKIDEYNLPMKYTKEELNFITKWLFKKEYLPFECDGLVYYVKFLKGTRWNNGAMQGYITLEMDILNGIAYEPVRSMAIPITTEGYIQIRNDSTAVDKIYPNYEFTIKQGDTVTILNETTTQSITFKTLQANEKITVDNNIKDMKSSVGLTRNVYGALSNKEWLYLANGVNKIKITCTSCDFKITYQNKMCLI